MVLRCPCGAMQRVGGKKLTIFKRCLQNQAVEGLPRTSMLPCRTPLISLETRARHVMETLLI